IDKSTDINVSKAALSQNLIATINGEAVYMPEVTAVYNNIPANMRTNTSLQEALDQVINNKLLLQDAESKEFRVSEEAVDNSINAFLANNGLTLQQLEQNLANAGSSIEIFRNSIRNNLLLQAEINEITKDVKSPSEAEIKVYYEDNKQSFTTIAKAKTRQLLIYANQTNQDAKLEQVKAIGDQLNKTNFCDLVEKHSEDLISIPRCGLYDFQQGQLLPEYEEIVFNSEPGSTKIIQTRIGYHIVQIINITYPKQLSLEEVKESINNLIVLRNKQTVLNQYIQNLRQEADVVSYLG
ncbi:peptidyl-prolyl cis-trans isomerase, partial [Candidatus Woesearchaeota archaeon]|nr:peptidyl-prolyl cis-trans isomerase [Candidatus Woesearchaeota archaeon]